jgi:hypothetical protein
MKRKSLIHLMHLPVMAAALTTVNVFAGTEATAAASYEDWLKVSGYAVGSYTVTDAGDTKDTFLDSGSSNLDSVKVGFETSQGALGSYVSLFYIPNNDAGILDAYLNYKAGSFTFTGGKYLSYLGYEAFDPINMYQLTYANGLGAIPAYHTGVKMDYATDTFGAGANVSDSIRGGNGFFVGDEDYSNGLGYEAYVTYKGIDKLTIWAGAGYDDTEGLTDWLTYNIWASYDLSDKLTLAGEIAYHEDGVSEGTQGLALAKYAFTDKFSTAFRYGIDSYSTGQPDTHKFTVAPTYAFCKSLSVRGELSTTQVTSGEDSVFTGAQVLVKF